MLDPLEYRPLKAEEARVAGVSGLSAEQVAALSAPWEPTVKPTAVATLESFVVSVDLSGVSMPRRYRLRVWVYILGPAATYAPLTHDPVPGRSRSRLHRLPPYEVDDSSEVEVTLPEALPVVRLACEVRGLFDAFEKFRESD